MTHLSTLVEIAADLRRRAKLRRPPYSTDKIAKHCFPRVTVTGGDLPPGIEEFVSRTHDCDLIVYARGLSTGHHRFAIAHAFAHVIFDLGKPDVACAVNFLGDPVAERRADHLAAETLAPLHEIRRIVRRWKADDFTDRALYLDRVDQIASRYHVPPFVIDRRIRWLEWSRETPSANC